MSITNAQVETELKNITKETKIKFEIDENKVYMSGLKNHFELDEENRLIFKTIQAIKIMDLVAEVKCDYYKFDDDYDSFVFDLHEEKEDDED